MEAVVLSRRDIGEADRMLTVFSRNLGKQTVVAKGVRRLTSRMAGHLEPGRLARVLYIETRGLALVTQAETRQLFIGPSQSGDNFKKLQVMFQVLEATNTLFDENQKDSQVFDLLIEALTQLKNIAQDRTPLIAAGYVLKLLARQGFSPELDKCISCQRVISIDQSGEPSGDLEQAEIYFSSSRGGLVHKKCSVTAPTNFTLNTDSLSLLHFLLEQDLFSLENNSSEKAIINQVSALIKAFFEWNTDRDYKSARLTDKLVTS